MVTPTEPLDLATLNALLADVGVAPFAFGPDRQRYLSLTPTTIEVPGERGGPDEVERFADEDALCRALLARELARKPPRPGVVLQAPPAARAAPGGGSGLVELWSRPHPRSSGLAARGHGLVLQLDAGPLLADPWHGVRQQHVLDVATGVAIGTAPVAAPHVRAAFVTRADGDVVLLLHDRGRLSAHDPADWAGGPRWSVRVALHAEVVETPDGGVLLCDADGDGVCLDLADGRVRWRAEELADPDILCWGVERHTNWTRACADHERVVVDVVDLRDGTTTAWVDERLPEAWTDASATVVAATLDPVPGPDVGGHVVVRVSGATTSWNRQPYGDLVATPGAVRLLGPSTTHTAPSGAVDRVVHDGDGCVLETLDGGTLWRRPAARLRGRVGGVSLLDSRLGEAPVLGVEDDGVARWSAPGAVQVVDGPEVWLLAPDDHLEVRDVASGRLLRRSRVPWPGRPIVDAPNRRHGYHPDDRTVLVTADGRLTAYAWR